MKFNPRFRLARSLSSLICLGVLVGIAAWSPAQFERVASANTVSTQVVLGPLDVADQFSWTYSPVLVTPDRWTNPRLALSTGGHVSALWEQKIGDDTSHLMAAQLSSDDWSAPERIGIVNPSVARITTWPFSAQPTVAWNSESDINGTIVPIGGVTLARQDTAGIWESVKVIQPGAGEGRWDGRGPRLEVATVQSGETVAILQNFDYAPSIVRWPAGSPAEELSAWDTSGWQETASTHWTEFTISSTGKVFAFVYANTGLEIRELIGTVWRTGAIIQASEDFKPLQGASPWQSPGPKQLQIGTDDSQVVVAWQQMDAKYGEDYQVWTATVRDGAVLLKALVYEHVRPGTWMNQRPRIAMNLAADGTRCLTYPTPPYGTLQGVLGNTGGWGEPVLTDITLGPSTSDGATRFTELSASSTELSASSMGCLYDSLYGWFDDTEAARIPQPRWTLPGAGTIAALANSAVAVDLAAAGTNHLQVALLDRSIPPVITAPGQVRKLTSKPQKGSVRFTWKPPADFGGASAVTYQWRVGKAKWAGTSALSVVIPAKKGKAVILQVRAVNSAGVGSTARATGRGR